uniref:Uncharacterized protein n=1 Tax=Rhizophora mucronata TaxID=61149 RepID=A0A2P2P1C5_RHIMU
MEDMRIVMLCNFTGHSLFLWLTHIIIWVDSQNCSMDFIVCGEACTFDPRK